MTTSTTSASDTLAACYTAFWEWFSQHERQFYQAVKDHARVEEYFFELLSPALDEVKPGLYFQAGMADDQTAELVVSAEGAIENLVFAEELVAAAPSLTGWKFTALKEAVPDIEQVVVRMGDFTFSTGNIHFYPNDGAAYPDEIAITVTQADLTKETRTPSRMAP